MTIRMDLPTISWRPGGNGRFEVRCLPEKHSSYTFQLMEEGTKHQEVTLKIEEVGHCFQQWIRKDENYDLHVRMFATPNRKTISFVATDLKSRKIEVWEEALNAKQWEDRLYQEQPNANHFTSIFSVFFKKWEKTSTKSAEVWKKAYEKSEVGLTRTYLRYGVENCEERVLYSTYTQYSRHGEDTRNWVIAKVLERTIDGIQTLAGSILKVRDCSTHDADLVQAVQFDEETQNLQIDGRVLRFPLGLYHLNRGGTPQIGFYDLDEERMYLQFMPDRDLTQVTHEEIARYVQAQCLVYQDEEEEEITTYQQESIEITKEVHHFDEGVMLPAIHIHMKQAFFRTALKCIAAFFPSRSEEERRREMQLYGSDIAQEMIRESILRPNAERYLRQTGIRELDRAHARSAEVDIYLSLNRGWASATVDQRIYAGYRFRRYLSPIARERAIELMRLAQLAENE